LALANQVMGELDDPLIVAADWQFTVWLAADGA
jgi:hypothetical protein